MDDRERARLRLTGNVAKLLKNRSFRDALPPLLADGTAPFVVGLEDDTLRDLWDRVSRLGGDAYVIAWTAMHDGDDVKLQVLRFSGALRKDIADLEPSTECPVNDKTTLGMLLADIKNGSALSYHIYDSETVIKFVNESVQCIPA